MLANPVLDSTQCIHAGTLTLCACPADFLKNKSAYQTAARRELAGGADATLHRATTEAADDIASALEGERGSGGHRSMEQ